MTFEYFDMILILRSACLHDTYSFSIQHFIQVTYVHVNSTTLSFMMFNSNTFLWHQYSAKNQIMHNKYSFKVPFYLIQILINYSSSMFNTCKSITTGPQHTFCALVSTLVTWKALHAGKSNPLVIDYFSGNPKS